MIIIWILLGVVLVWFFWNRNSKNSTSPQERVYALMDEQVFEGWLKAYKGELARLKGNPDALEVYVKQSENMFNIGERLNDMLLRLVNELEYQGNKSWKYKIVTRNDLKVKKSKTQLKIEDGRYCIELKNPEKQLDGYHTKDLVIYEGNNLVASYVCGDLFTNVSTYKPGKWLLNIHNLCTEWEKENRDLEKAVNDQELREHSKTREKEIEDKYF